MERRSKAGNVCFLVALRLPNAAALIENMHRMAGGCTSDEWRSRARAGIRVYAKSSININEFQ